MALVTLEPDGLITVTENRPTKRGLVRRVRRESGESVWAWERPLPDKLTAAPRSFRYPANSGKEMHELFLSQLDTVFVLDWRYGDLLESREHRFPISTS